MCRMHLTVVNSCFLLFQVEYWSHLSICIPLSVFYHPSFFHSYLISLFPCSLDATPSVAGAPGAPMSVKAYDINSDYVLVAWKPPNTVNEAAITGYFVDRSV